MGEMIIIDIPLNILDVSTTLLATSLVFKDHLRLASKKYLTMSAGSLMQEGGF